MSHSILCVAEKGRSHGELKLVVVEVCNHYVQLYYFLLNMYGSGSRQVYFGAKVRKLCTPKITVVLVLHLPERDNFLMVPEREHSVPRESH